MASEVKYFCISDIHSYYSAMLSALISKGFDIENSNHKVIICGDAFDRGDDTVKVFEFMKKLQSQDRLIYIKGNHEELLFDCINEMLNNKTPGSHHFHNKKVKTICMLCGQNEWIAYAPQSPDIRELIKEKTSEVTKFIEDNAVNFFELGNKIFVHSWIPCKIKGNDCTWNPVYEKPYDWYNQDKVSLDEKAQKLYNSEWSSARWGNPFLMWKNKLYPEGKCIVFGHYHCSYGHSHLDMKCKEWPQVNQKNWTDCFKPWIKENAIGIDSCVAFSGFLNCLVFDEGGNLLDE
jgi:serine/threonine protein phosphatase 1